MPNSTLETVWKFGIDEGEAKEAENFFTRLAKTIKEKIGGDGTKAIKATTEAIEDQTRALKDAEDQAKKTGQSYDDRLKRVKEGGADFSGDVASASGGLRGAVDTFSGGNSGAIGGILEFTEAIADVGEYAPQAATQIGTLVSSLGPVGLGLAAVVAVAAAAVVAASQSIQKEADRITQVGEKRLELAERIADGLSTDDALAEIEANNNRRVELEKERLRAEQEYNDFLAQQPDILGNLGDNLLKVGDSREAAYEKTINDVNARLEELGNDNQVLQEAVDQGRTTTEKAVQAEGELADARSTTADTTRQAEKAARDQEQVQKKAQQEQEKAAAEAERQAEQLRQKQEQIEQKRLDAARKYGDSMVDIANKAKDSAKEALTTLKQSQADNQRSLQDDLSDAAADFAASEREEAIARMEEEARDLHQHALKLTQIRDDAFIEEEDLLRKRDFLGATRVREAANRQIEQENKTLIDAQQEKARLQQQEDAQQLREQDKARRERLIQLQRANAEAKLQYDRDIQSQKEARRIAERDAALARDRELRAANDMARALLGIHQQSAQAQMQLAQGVLNSLRGLGNTTNNTTSNVTNNNQRSLSISGAAMNPQQIQRIAIQTLGAVGLS